MNLVIIGEYCIEIYTRDTIDTIIMYTFILRLAIRMYTIELGKTSKTERYLSTVPKWEPEQEQWQTVLRNLHL